MDYNSSGVDVCRSEELVNWLKSKKNKHHQNLILSKIGGFSSLFKLNLTNFKDPCLASTTDGVGTKLKVALKYSSLQSLGQDLVAMCVNDLICVGAIPLFFLDYYACGKLQLSQSKNLIEGIQKACDASKCALIGGETAEMPGLYSNNDFDLAGFTVGIVDQSQILGSHNVKQGDYLLGLPSSGFHSNGYSLLRKVFEKDMDSWSSELLKPTTIYTDIFIKILQKKTKAIAHITGGGLDNILRVVPQGSEIQLNPWSIPSPFIEVKKRTNLSWLELLKTLNCGIGLVCFVEEKNFSFLFNELKKSNISPIDLGKVINISPHQESKWSLDYSHWNKTYLTS